jgi:asparagine synthase (glutamine-hydrolysing)
MCGVAGIIDYQGIENKQKVLEAMLSAIAYRGPDECGIYQSDHVTMGNVRLSIIDLKSGQQPISDSSGRYWIVFNGEIFNYKELRKDLEGEGVRFRTTSDTEVLVQLYVRHGKDCLNLLNGQFVFAIWDNKDEELFMARDRVGIRPLFYNLSNGIFSFASEIKSLFEQKRVPCNFDPVNLSQIYTFWTALTPNTAFKDIFELSPGHFLVYNRNGLKINRFWELRFDKKRYDLSLGNAIEEFHELFTNAVRIRLRADVEVAAYLSGGIDSSATVAYIKDIEPGVLNTFSIKFDEGEYDESSYQTDAVRYFNTNHKSFTCSASDIAENFPQVVWHSETPVTRTAPVPMMMLSKLVRDNNIKVVITGEGSDEILAGYNIFKEGKIRRFWAVNPDSRIRPLLLTRLYPYLPQMKQSSTNVLKMFFGYNLSDTDNPLYSHLLRWNNSNHIKKHLRGDLLSGHRDYSPLDDLLKGLPEGFEKWEPLAKSQWLETTVFMSGYLLSSQGDRMAMANSIEGRYPFLDYRVIEFCSSLPPDFKLKILNEKYLLKRLLKNKIPESILTRAKQPYRAPTKNVFLSEKTPELIKFMLSKEQFENAGIFNFDSVDGIISKINKTGTSSEIENMLLTCVVSTHLLHHQFMGKHHPSSRELPNLKLVTDKVVI